jgi:hypothetical protein
VQTASVSNLQACTWYYFAAKVRSSNNEHSGLSRFRVKTLCGGGGGLSAVQVPGREGGVPATSFARQAAPASSVAPGSSLGWELRFEPAGEGLSLYVTRAAESPEAGAQVALEHLTTDGWQRVPSGSSFAGQDIAVMTLKENWRLLAPASYTASGLAGGVGEAGNSAWVLSAANHSAHGSLNPAAVELAALAAGDTLTLDYARGAAAEAEAWFCLLDTEQASAATRGRGPRGDTPGPEALRFALHAGQPTPSRGPTLLRFDLPEAMDLRLEIFDVHGRRIRELARGRFHAGAHAIEWNGRDVKGQRVRPGIYTCRLETAAHRAQMKLVVVP